MRNCYLQSPPDRIPSGTVPLIVGAQVDYRVGLRVEVGVSGIVCGLHVTPPKLETPLLGTTYLEVA